MVDDRASSQPWWPNAGLGVDGPEQSAVDWELELTDFGRGDPLSQFDVFDEPLKVPCTNAFGPMDPTPAFPRKILADQAPGCGWEAAFASKTESLALENARLVWENHMLRQQQTQEMASVGASQWWWPSAEPWMVPPPQGDIQPGAVVCFQNLSVATELNGACGTVERWDEASCRWVVRLVSGEEKFAKPEKLLVLQEACHFGEYYCPPQPQVPMPFMSWPSRGRAKRASTDARRMGSGSTASCSESTAATAAGSVRSNMQSFASEEGLDSGFQGMPGHPPLTTVMMRNIPNDYTRSMLLDLLDREGFAGRYDLVYLPIDYQSQVGFGYAFIDLISPAEAENFRRHFEGFRDWGVVSEKVCEVCWSNVLQGVQAHIDRYRNSPVMHESVPDEFKPMLFLNGKRVPFPGPTKSIRPPRLRRKDPK